MDNRTKSKNISTFSSFRCEFNVENTNDKMMVEKILHLREITQFNNKQLLNLLLCIGNEAIGNCQNFSDLLGLFSINCSIQPSIPKNPVPEKTSESISQHKEDDTISTSSNASLNPQKINSSLENFFQNEDDPETEKMIAEMFDL